MLKTSVVISMKIFPFSRKNFGRNLLASIGLWPENDVPQVELLDFSLPSVTKVTSVDRNDTKGVRRRFHFSHSLLLIACAFLIAGCGKSEPKRTIFLEEGPWRFILDMGGEDLRFNSHLTKTPEGYFLTIHNASETIRVDEVTRMGDSLVIKMPVFDSEFRGKIISSHWLKGHWHNFAKGPDYNLPFEAVYGESTCEKLKLENEALIDVSGKWEVTFSPGKEEEYPAVGVFEQTGTQVTGTFLTETGDYRFLEGFVEGNHLRLSCFDGAHAFVFTASLLNEKLEGKFQSGSHWQEPWTGFKNPYAKLASPDKLTHLKGNQPLAFSFPNLEGKMVSLAHPRYQGKVVIIQIMGSWCPNCLDESKLFVDWHKRYHAKGLEIIALAYERAPFSKSVANLNRLKNRLGIEYEILFASASPDKDEAAKTLPMLDHVLSFPTSIFIDRNGKVQKIHTGFNGPGTGEVYTQFKAEYETMLERMLR